jgi:hypothetical protein
MCLTNMCDDTQFKKVMVASSGCEQLMDGGLFAVRLRAFF